jgi:hypothetical protein
MSSYIVLVFVSTDTTSSAICQIRAVIHNLHGKNISSTEIYERFTAKMKWMKEL